MDQKIDSLPSKAQLVRHQVSARVYVTQEFSKCCTLDFPGGAVVKNPPASAGYTG